ETRRPCALKYGISRVSNVVLPAPLQPARPMTFITDPSPRSAWPLVEPSLPPRHCERSEAIQSVSADAFLDCLAALAMTSGGILPIPRHAYIGLTRMSC